MILRIDRLQTEMPPPSDPDPAGAARVQELMGGRFGEMSTLMNYTFQSFNFRNRQGARPFYDLIANIAAEEYGHIELVATAINTMLTGATPPADGKPPGDALTDLRDEAINPHHFLAGGQGALPQDSRATPWTGDYVFSSGDLVEDLTHNFFLETGARNNKLKVYEMCDHPAARALTGYLLVRGGVHQVAYARAVELLTGADLTKMFPTPRIPTAKIPECQPHIEKGLHLKLYRFSPSDYKEIVAVFRGPRAHRLPARPRRRAPGGVRARAGEPDGREHDEAVPVAADPDGQDPGVPAAHPGGNAPQALPLLALGLPRDRRRLQRPAPRDRRGATGRRRGTRGLPAR
ncbi:MAG TPA: manganese catalase family protein, partial [Solirubrobacteraceae bacterium]|nr:manganese catalase family protein [Solirubrobacteraceae bacterium]